jgi:aminoglycoside 3-N-acetyltransferase
MSEAHSIDPARQPLTIELLAGQLAACGLSAGQTVLAHTRMSALGWIAGGAAALIHALLHVLTPQGTLMMPTFSADNSDPANWSNPPVPQHWWPVIRAHMPAYDPDTTPTWGMGRVPELFRRWPGAVRSAHPVLSFTALGPRAAWLTGGHTSLERPLDDDSPLGRLYAADGHVLLLGVDHSHNTSLHLAEYRARIPHTTTDDGCAMRIDGQRQWVSYKAFAWDDSDFAALGAAFEAQTGLLPGHAGTADVRLMRQRPLVDFGVGWLEQHRTPAGG